MRVDKSCRHPGLLQAWRDAQRRLGKAKTTAVGTGTMKNLYEASWNKSPSIVPLEWWWCISMSPNIRHVASDLSWKDMGNSLSVSHGHYCRSPLPKGLAKLPPGANSPTSASVLWLSSMHPRV